jgi:hypothetical protein
VGRGLGSGVWGRLAPTLWSGGGCGEVVRGGGLGGEWKRLCVLLRQVVGLSGQAAVCVWDHRRVVSPHAVPHAPGDMGGPALLLLLLRRLLLLPLPPSLQLLLHLPPQRCLICSLSKRSCVYVYDKVRADVRRN